MPPLGRGSGDAPALRPVQVDDGRAPRRQQVAEEAQLRLEVILDGRMIVEMVAAEIGEGGRGQPHPVEAALVDPVRGGFHRQMRDSVPGEVPERLVQGDGAGRRQRAVIGALCRHDADRAEARARMAGGLEELACELGDRAFPAGSGHSDDGAGLAWMEARGGEGEGPPGIAHPQIGDFREQGWRALDLADDGARAAREGVGDEGGAVGLDAGNGHEGEALLDLAAVIGEAGDGTLPVGPRLGEQRPERRHEMGHVGRPGNGFGRQCQIGTRALPPRSGGEA